MDAPNPSSTVTFANRTPLRIGAVGLKARDLDNLAADAGNIAYAGAPGALRIGHIHLRVGDLAPTQQFYGAVGMMPTAGRGGALFMSSGRYHHHVGSNIWQSAGAGRRDDD